jgi:hypothetical protein
MSRCATRIPSRYVHHATMSLALLLLLASNSSAQTVRGRVLDGDSLTTLAATAVRLIDASGDEVAFTVSDDSGRFVLQAPQAGHWTLRAERLGYATADLGPLVLESGRFTDLQIRLRVDAVRLDALIVATERTIAALDRVGFYDRLRAGRGRFVQRQQMDLRPGAATAVDFMQGIPGVRLLPLPNGDYAVVLSGGVAFSASAALCRPRVWLDGILVHTDPREDFDWRSVHASGLEAIEVYSRPSQIPAQYGGASSSCGVVLLWTRKS